MTDHRALRYAGGCAVLMSALAVSMTAPVAAQAQSTGAGSPPATSSFVPSNDAFAAPFVLPGPSGSINSGQFNDGATAEVGEPQHKPGLAPHASVWYRWTSPVTGRVIFRTKGSNFDTILAVYTGSTLASLAQLATDDDSSFDNGGLTLQSETSFEAFAGTTYRIAVDSFNAASTGRIRLSWTTNDDFAAAQQLPGPTAGQTLVASTDNNFTVAQSGEPAHAGDTTGHSVWFAWTAPDTALARFTTFGDDFNTVLGAYKGDAVNALTEVARNDNISEFDKSSEITFAATKGTTYRIAISGFNEEEGFTLLRYRLEGPAIKVGDASVVEGNSGTKTLNFPVTLSQKSPATVTVAFATANGTALAGTDYVTKSGTLTFLAGQTTKTVGVTINGDTVHESLETFSVGLSAAAGGAATIADATGTGTILTDE